MGWEHYYEKPYGGTVTADYYILRDLLHKSRLGQFNLWQLKVAASVFKDANARRKRPSKKIDALCALITKV
jgi:hypothetical protein